MAGVMGLSSRRLSTRDRADLLLKQHTLWFYFKIVNNFFIDLEYIFSKYNYW